MEREGEREGESLDRFNITITDDRLLIRKLGIELEILQYVIDFSNDKKLEYNLVKDKFIVIGSYILEIIFLSENIL